jgi:hypothetical protein
MLEQCRSAFDPCAEVLQNLSDLIRKFLGVHSHQISLDLNGVRRSGYEDAAGFGATLMHDAAAEVVVELAREVGGRERGHVFGWRSCGERCGERSVDAEATALPWLLCTATVVTARRPRSSSSFEQSDWAVRAHREEDDCLWSSGGPGVESAATMALRALSGSLSEPFNDGCMIPRG